MSSSVTNVNKEAFMYYKKADYSAAVDTINNALVIFPDDPKLILLLGQTYASWGKNLDALNAFVRLREIRPDESEPEMMLGWCYACAQKIPKAKAHFVKAINLNTGDYACRLSKALLNYYEEQYNDALNAVVEAQRVDNEAISGHSLKAMILLKLRRYEEAKEAVLVSLAITPFYVNDLLVLGQAEEALCNYEEALAAYDKAIAVDPSYLRPYTLAGSLSFKIFRFRLSWKYAKQSVTAKNN